MPIKNMKFVLFRELDMDVVVNGGHCIVSVSWLGMFKSGNEIKCAYSSAWISTWTFINPCFHFSEVGILCIDIFHLMK